MSMPNFKVGDYVRVLQRAGSPIGRITRLPVELGVETYRVETLQVGRKMEMVFEIPEDYLWKMSDEEIAMYNLKQ